MRARGRTAAIAASLLLAPALAAAGGASPRSFRFERAVGNVETARRWLRPVPPIDASRVPKVEGTAWYGQIMRRLPEEVASLGKDHYVPFLAEYRDGVAARAWCDDDLDGDLSDRAPLPLSAYPGIDGARSFLVDLSWNVPPEPRGRPVRWTVRVVLEPAPGPGAPEPVMPRYRVQMVHAMMGEVVIEGRTHRALLLDGTADGFYTRDLLDGMLVDLDDDGHLDVDQMSPEFGPFGAPFTMGRTSYEVVSLDPEGREVSLRAIGPAPPVPPAPAAGEPAPEVAYRSVSGEPVSLSSLRGRPAIVYFWASWCPACAGQADGLARLYERLHPQGLEILAISYDTDRDEMVRFREAHGQRWPTSFSGRQAWEDPVGRIYRARDMGTLYLVDRDGRLDGIYSTLDELERRLARLIPEGAPQRQSPAARKAPQ